MAWRVVALATPHFLEQGMKVFFFVVLSVGLLLSGCSSMPRTANPTNMDELPQKDFDAINDCSLKYPDQEQSFDDTTGYFYWEGKDAAKVRDCLKKDHGWFEFGLPDWKPGTMVPPG